MRFFMRVRPAGEHILTGSALQGAPQAEKSWPSNRQCYSRATMDGVPVESRRVSRWSLAAALLFAVMIPLFVRMALGAGITTDELVQRVYGDLILDYVRSGFRDERALSYINLYLYGGLFELPTQWILSTHSLPWPTYESRHVLTALVGLS